MATDRVGPDATLRPLDLPVKDPGDGAVLIKVMAAAVNPADLGMVAGSYRWYDELRLPLVPGYDVAGVVVAGDWEVGAAVIASTGHSRTQAGGFAEYVTLPASYLAPAPKNLDWEQAATIPLAGITAHQALELIGLQAGQTLLVNGPRGAVGHFAVELARRAGATVIEAGRDDKPLDRAVDAALDVVGGPRARQAFAAVRDGGTYVTAVPEFWVPGGQFTAERGITPQLVRAESDGARLSALSAAADAGDLTTTVAKTLPLDQAQDALDLLAARAVRGRLVLVP